MANQPSPKNVFRGIRVPRDMDAKVIKRFGGDGMTVKDAYILALIFATKNVTLSADDYIRIAREIQNATNNH